MNRENLDFRFRQEPGPQNILGQYRFLFPNPYDVYGMDRRMASTFFE